MVRVMGLEPTFSFRTPVSETGGLPIAPHSAVLTCYHYTTPLQGEATDSNRTFREFGPFGPVGVTGIEPASYGPKP